ncbi:MAG TPA: hypothetical protein VNC60_10510, partial [Actinomycetota bacterium]|nr:hypothetical protein [Actinomycetota bacterium]
RGPYAAFATAEVGTRPGVLVDQMEQLLLVAEEGRTRRDALRVPDPAAAPSGKPRTSLHPQHGKPVEAGPAEVPVAAAPESVVVEPGPVIVEPSTADQKPAAASPTAAGEGLQDPSADDSEVDPILLAKEFSGLLQLDSDDDE